MRRALAGAFAALTVLTGCTSSGGESTGTDQAPVTSAAPTVSACTAPAPARPVPGGLPDVTLDCLGDGPRVRLSDLRGPLLVNVWAQWCGPCRAEAPYLAAVHASGRIPLVGIDYVDPKPDAARAFAAEHKWDYMHLQDPERLVQPGLRIVGPPVTVFVAADGRIVYTHQGPFTSTEQLRRLVADKLGVAA